jgi:hypothetical protein
MLGGGVIEIAGLLPEARGKYQEGRDENGQRRNGETYPQSLSRARHARLTRTR